MNKQGGIVLGSGGDCCIDNFNLAVGTFYEGAIVTGYPNDQPKTRCKPTSSPPATASSERPGAPRSSHGSRSGAAAGELVKSRKRLGFACAAGKAAGRVPARRRLARWKAA
jgi:hypothetical protein